MNKPDYDTFVRTFFECDPKAITEIFKEFLAAMAAEEALPPGRNMSQNYETAQANPEIHFLPGNLKDARDAIFPYFWGTDGWSSALHLENVRGPANYASLIGAIACLLKNPNLCTDTYSERSNELEVKAITALANLLFYHTDDPWGIFTIGGTISNFYGAKIGIEKVLPGSMSQGLQGKRIVGLCSQAAHYCSATIAGWSGIGTQNLVTIPTDGNMSMRLDLLAEKLDELYEREALVAFVIATFGTTDAFGVDDVAAIRKLIDEKAHCYGVTPPQLHADAALGWGLCFLNDYDQVKNPLELTPALLPRVARIQEMCQGMKHADSVTIDFHKIGRGHYPSSAFIVNRKSDLKYLARAVTDTPYFSDADPRRDPALFTLETSRPGLGPYIVMASLNGIGLYGWQMLVARGIELAETLKRKIDELDYCKVLNRDVVGTNVVFWVLPRGRDAKTIFAKLEANELQPEEQQRYLGEVRRLFHKRQSTLRPEIDARVSLTTDIGYRPHGVMLPAWKAVFFNPKTDEKVIDRLVESIEELV